MGVLPRMIKGAEATLTKKEGSLGAPCSEISGWRAHISLRGKTSNGLVCLSSSLWENHAGLARNLQGQDNKAV